MLNNGRYKSDCLLAIRSLNMQYTPAGDSILASLTTLESPPLEFKGTRRMSGAWTSHPMANTWQQAAAIRQPTVGCRYGRTIRIFSGHTGEIDGVEFSPDGKYLLAGGGADHTALLWDVASGETVQIFSGHTGSIDDAAFSPDGKLIVTAGGEDKTARIWEVAQGKRCVSLRS
jgi:WD40 repeat protein